MDIVESLKDVDWFSLMDVIVGSIIVLSLIALIIYTIKEVIIYVFQERNTQLKANEIIEEYEKASKGINEKQLFLRRLTDAFLDSKKGDSVILDSENYLYITRGNESNYGGYYIAYGCIYNKDPLNTKNYEIIYRQDRTLNDDDIQSALELLEVMNTHFNDCEVYKR